MAASPTPATECIAPRNPLELKLTQIWEQLLKVQPIGIHDDFFKLGGDSISAMALLALVAQETGQPLPAGGLLQAPTIAQLAATLSADVDPDSWSPMVPIQTEGSRRPLFCVHPGGGNVLCYLRLSQNLGNDQPFYALQAPGVDGIREPLSSIEAMAREYVSAIREVQPHGPYAIAGWSSGGVIAFEVAQQLHAAGEVVATLGIIDSGVLYTMGILSAMSPDGQPGVFEMMGKSSSQQVKEFRIRSASAKLIPDEADEAMAVRIMEMFERNVQATVNYRCADYAGRVDLYQAEELLVPSRRQPFAEWSNVCTHIHLHHVPGNHLTMVHDPHVQGLAAAISSVLAECSTSDKPSA
jgi:thioesterase domain-containing protein/aryl carrier-like protein